MVEKLSINSEDFNKNYNFFGRAENSKIPFNEEDVILTLYPVLVTTVQVKVIDPLPLAVV